MKRERIKKLLFFIIPCIILGLMLLSFWPGIYTSDGGAQWEQVQNGTINNAHPFFSTFFFMLLLKIWNNQTVLLIFQIIVFSYVWYSICKEVYSEDRHFKTIIIYTIFMCLTPIISMYAITVWKDVLYSYYLLAITYFIYKGIKNNFKYSKLDLITIGILISLVFNYRHNGMIVAVILLIVFFIILKKIAWKKIGIIFITFISCFCIVAILKYNYLDDSNANNKTLSTLDGFVNWMIGAQLYRENIENEDLQILDKYIPTDEWKSLYSAYLINPISLYKNGDNKYYIENRDEIRKIFFKYLIRNPGTIIIHYLKADALLWSPIPIGYVYQYDFKIWGPNYSFDNLSTSKIPIIEEVYEKFVTLTMRKPIRVIMYQPATIMYLSLVLLFVIVKIKNNKQYWLLSTPMLFNIVSLIPINPAQDLRYVYINYLTLAFIGLLCVLNYKEAKIYFKGIFKKRS